MDTKPYGSDSYNGLGFNVKDEGLPDMLAFLEFALSEDVVTTTRIKYTWLDALAFVGGIIQVFLISIYSVSWFNNYGLVNY